MVSLNDQQRTVVFSFKDAISKLESDFALLKKGVKFMNEKFEGELDRRLIVEDFKRGMRQVNELLRQKFAELADLESALTDNTTFLKLYLPTKVQLQVNESLMHLVNEGIVPEALERERYVFGQQARFKALLEGVEA